MINYISGVLGALLQQLYHLLENLLSAPAAYALSIILFTIFIKVILIPLSVNQQKSMAGMQKIQPELTSIQERSKKAKTKEEQAAINMEMTELYKKHKVNPFGGCLPLLIQFPILIGLYRIFMESSKYTPKIPSHALEQPFLWLPQLGALKQGVQATWISSTDPYFILPILVGLTMFLSTRITQKITPQPKSDNPQAAQTAQMMKTMNIMFPFMMAYFTIKTPAGIGIYFLIGNIFQIFQTFLVNKIVQREDIKGA